jgi:hypothetical protein
VSARADLIEPQPELSIRRQCVLLNVPRGRWYAPAAVELAEDLELKRLLDEEYLRHPFYGSRRMTAYLQPRLENHSQAGTAAARGDGPYCGGSQTHDETKRMRSIRTCCAMWQSNA